MQKASAKPPVVAILGGSISFGSELAAPFADRYSAQLSGMLNATVLNLALPATGVAGPSFCLETVLPNIQQVDFLVLE